MQLFRDFLRTEAKYLRVGVHTPSVYRNCTPRFSVLIWQENTLAGGSVRAVAARPHEPEERQGFFIS